MLARLFKTILLPKRARHKLEAREKAAGQPQAAAGRERVLDEALAVYRRQQREVYDKLDAETRRQIEEDAAKAFGDVLGSKD
jgi:hypothetical protein